MKDMEVYIAAGAIFVLILIILAFNGKKPKSKTFSCARCKKREPYSQRTIEAWRRGFKKIYCRQCHKKWLENNPNQKHQKANYNRSGGGCLSALFIALFIPVTIYTVSTYVS